MKFNNATRSLCLLSIFFLFSIPSYEVEAAQSDFNVVSAINSGFDGIEATNTTGTSITICFDFNHIIANAGAVAGGAKYSIYGLIAAPGVPVNTTSPDADAPTGYYTFYKQTPVTGCNINNTPDFYGNYYFNNGSLTEVEMGLSQTRIIDFDPQEGAVETSPVTFTLEYYVNPQDIGQTIPVRFYFQNINQNNLLNPFFDDSLELLDIVATSSGLASFSTTTVLEDGCYRVNAILGYQTWFANFFAQHLASYDIQNMSHQFVVGTCGFIGNIAQNSFSQVTDIFASSTATSTAALARTCVPFSGDFDTIECIAFLLVPDSGYLYDSLDSFRNSAATHFPLGYITHALSIISTSTVGTLTVIDASVPPGLPGAGSHIRLDLTNVLDPFLNNTNDQFTGSTTDGRTFYETTVYYWQICVYILTALYILRRVIGSHLIPH